MALYLIDGLPGTGKTTLGKILKSQGYEVYDGDEDNLAHWYAHDTGEQVAKEREERTPEFLQTHSRHLDPKAVAKLATQTTNKTIFITNDPGNLLEVARFFDQCFALVLDEPTRQQRIDTRTNNDWGKLPHEREHDSQLALKAPARYQQFSHIPLDASQTPASIADELLELITKLPQRLNTTNQSTTQ